MKRLIPAALLVATLAGCAGLNDTEQRALTGTGGGAAAGAVVGAIAGNAGLGALIGAGAGLAGGLIYNNVKQSEQSAYNQGYARGRNSSPP